MKKVGIVTFSRTNNYGARLQSYAMYSIFKELGYDVELVNLAYPKRHAKYILGRILNKSKSPDEWIKKYLITFKMFRFTKQINLTRTMLTKSTVKMVDFINKRNYDAVICGSDEIWCSRQKEIAPPSIYFLPKEINARRISFSPSANGNHKFTDEEIRWLTDTFRGYSYLGVRDNMTNSLLEKCGISEGKVMFDPTLYYQFKDVPLPSVLESSGKKKICFAFARPDNGLPSKILQSIKDIYGDDAEYYSIFNGLKGTKFLPISPQQFACIFKKFDIVYTNFFHATIFSLKCNTPVYGMDTFNKYQTKVSKIEDLLSRLNLKEYFYSDIHSGQEQYQQIIAKSKGIIDGKCKCDFTGNVEMARNELAADINRIKEIIG